jgi:class 3 adenylate cyclase
MGLLDALTGPRKELEEAKRELTALRERLSKAEKEIELVKGKNVQQIEKTHAFLDKLRLLVGTLDGDQVTQRTWDLMDLFLSIRKGAVFCRQADGWHADTAVGFGEGPIPVIPLDEESIALFAVQNEVVLSLAHIRNQPDLSYLERRGVVPDVKIACPVRVRGEFTRVLLICQYGGNVFSGEDDCELMQMVASILGLVLTNTQIMAEQKAVLDSKVMELGRLRQMFSRMVAPEVIRFIEKNPGGIQLGGAKQHVAIFFVDIRGFTRMSELIPPETVIELLNRYFSRVTDIAMKYQGTLDKFMGDAAMILWGVPMSQETPCLNAVQAAEEIQDMVQDCMAEWVAMGVPAFTVGIGINYQEVIAGNVGSQKLSSYTVIGDGVNLASRLAALAAGGETLVSESLYQNLTGWNGHTEERQGIRVKGKSEPITVYSLSRVRTYEEGPCPKCGTTVLEGVKFCGKCGFRRY